MTKPTRLRLAFSVEVLLGVDADPNIQDSREQTPLHALCASAHGQTTEVELALALLLKFRATPNTQMRGGTTPLHVAVGMGYENLALALVHGGASMNIPDDKVARTASCILSHVCCCQRTNPLLRRGPS